MIRTLKILVSLWLVFSLHRLLSWAPLSATYSGHHGILWREILTGTLSDFWIATLLSLPFWFFEASSRRPAKSLQKFLGTVWILVWTGLTAGHQAYVEFFKFQIIPFHLSYLTDRSFIASNGESMIETSSAVILVLGGLLAYWSRSATVLKAKRQIAARFLAVILMSLMAHTTNIHWRVDWFIIEPLQANYLEALYSNLGKKPTIVDVSAEEMDLFKTLTKTDGPLTAPDVSSPNPMLKAITLEVARIRRSGRPVIVGVVLSESLRDADTGPRPKDGDSITPGLDRLQSMGVRFTHAYSSGPVTRGGQEAAWCGTPSATDTSLMRSFPGANIPCLPGIFRNDPAVKTLWIHGGDEQFDSQKSFWSHQGVSQFLTKSDFGSTAPKTGWGISDLAVFDRGTSLIAQTAADKSVAVIYPMILTVTNHIPWALPDDASIETKSFVAPHPQHKTLKYFDESLELFVGNLKQAGLWEQTILIVMGDHGNLEPTWKSPYEGDPLKWERMLSHISLTLTGGIIERLRGRDELPDIIETFTAQTQVAPFLTTLGAAQIETAKPMDAPLFETSPWPVASDLNQYLVLPKDHLKLPKEDVLAGKIPMSEKTSWIAATRYRAWLQRLYSRQETIHPPTKP
jgi:hypothetical protein